MTVVGIQMAGEGTNFRVNSRYEGTISHPFLHSSDPPGAGPIPMRMARTTIMVVLVILATTRASAFHANLLSVLVIALVRLRAPSCNGPNGCRLLGDIVQGVICTSCRHPCA